MPSNFKGIPLLDQKLIFDVLLYIAGDMTEAEVHYLLKSQLFKYPKEVLFLSQAAFTSAEIEIQFGCYIQKASSNVTCSRHTYC